jgi:hypothetical protein
MQNWNQSSGVSRLEGTDKATSYNRKANKHYEKTLGKLFKNPRDRTTKKNN